MARVLVTGSADGLGRMAAELLVDQGHEAVLHARNAKRAEDAWAAVPGAAGVLVGDLSTIEGMRAVADQAGEFDAVIHNAGVYLGPRIETADGLAHVFAINVLAPYVLTALIPANRLVYLGSGMHRGGDADLSDPQWTKRRWNSSQAYSDSKLYDTVLAAAVARRWPSVLSNTVEPGWVATRMGGPGAPDDLTEGATTQVWLAVSDDPAVHVSGRLFYHRRQYDPHPAVHDERFGEELLAYCARLSGVVLGDRADWVHPG